MQVPYLNKSIWIISLWVAGFLCWEGGAWAQTATAKQKLYKCKKCDGLAKVVPPDRPEPKECSKGGKCNFQPYVRSCNSNWHM